MKLTVFTKPYHILSFMSTFIEKLPKAVRVLQLINTMTTAEVLTHRLLDVVFFSIVLLIHPYLIADIWSPYRLHGFLDRLL